jgi:hypothetical protein
LVALRHILAGAAYEPVLEREPVCRQRGVKVAFKAWIHFNNNST